MSKIVRVGILIVAIIAIFEIGLFASYSVISSEPINLDDFVSFQTDEVSGIIASITGDKTLDEQQTINVTNEDEVAMVLNNLTGLSVNLNSVSAKVATDDTGNQTVNITALGTKDTQQSSGGVVQIVPEETYSITATATGEVYSNQKVKIQTDTISLTEKILLYNSKNVKSQTANQTNNTTNNSTIGNIIEYAKNTTSTNNTTANTTNNTTANNST